MLCVKRLKSALFRSSVIFNNQAYHEICDSELMSWDNSHKIWELNSQPFPFSVPKPGRPPNITILLCSAETAGLENKVKFLMGVNFDGGLHLDVSRC